MNINLILNSENLPFLNQLNKYKETEKVDIQKTNKKKSESVKEIIYFFNKKEQDFIPTEKFSSSSPLNSLTNYNNYIKLSDFMNNNKNSKLIIYYKKENKEKLSQTKKILTFLNENNDFKKIHKEIEHFTYYYNFRQKNLEYFLKDENYEIYINAEGKLNNSYFEKVNEFKTQYFNDKGEIILDNEEEFEEIEFIKLPDISSNKKEYIIFFLLGKLSEKYENIPIIHVENFLSINTKEKFSLEKNHDLIFFKYFLYPIIIFKNIKKIDEILEFINKNTYIEIDNILNEFYEKKKEKDFSQYYDFKN